MANHKSAEKRARQSLRRATINGRRKASVRTQEKKLLKAIDSKSLSDLPELLKSYVSQLAKAAQKGVFKREMASRKVGKLSAKVHQILNTK